MGVRVWGGSSAPGTHLFLSESSLCLSPATPLVSPIELVLFLGISANLFLLTGA